MKTTFTPIEAAVFEKLVHLKFNGLKDSLVSLYLFDKPSLKQLEPCDLYLYQTADPSLRKFGISFDHNVRADSDRKYIWNKFITCRRFEHRYQAFLVEQYIAKICNRKSSSNEVKLPRSTELMSNDKNWFNDTINKALMLLEKHGAAKFAYFIENNEWTDNFVKEK